MTKLHQLLAIEPTRQSAATKQIAERIATFKNKVTMYNGQTRILRMFGKDDTNRMELEAIEAKDYINTPVQATVPKDMNYMAGVVGGWLDTVLRKEFANQTAKADVIVDGVVLIKDAPALFLLGMETSLKQLRDVYEGAPTLPPGIEWVHAPEIGSNIYKMSAPDKDLKTLKVTDHKQLRQSTDKHPDTWVVVETAKNVGEFTVNKSTGVISVADKAALITRFDKLLMAIKDARTRANEVEVVMTNKCSDNVFRFLHGNWHDPEQIKVASSL